MNIVITGASKGIGYAIAETFASHGHDVYLTSKTASDLKTTADTLAMQFPNVQIHQMAADLSKQAEVTNFANWCLHLTRALLPSMLSNHAGHIFNICSIASLAAYENGGAYSISKFALLGFSKNLRLELKDQGIKVTAVCPGAVYTNSWSGSGVDPKRIMEASDIAKMIYAATQLSPQAVVEDIVMRPHLGDL